MSLFIDRYANNFVSLEFLRDKSINELKANITLNQNGTKLYALKINQQIFNFYISRNLIKLNNERLSLNLSKV